MGNRNCVRAECSACFYFATTINVLEGLVEYAKGIGGREELETAQTSAEEYLYLLKRPSTSQPADENVLGSLSPTRWRCDTRAL
ncbi:hypothetical protein E5D57_004661 [Metarhizium anisopliae]|nr:hypothetical protein E5D57_004661 [Metarhizium anisopliae]